MSLDSGERDVRSKNSLQLSLNESSRLSIDTSVNLNDDLANESDVSGSFISQPTNSHRRHESIASFRNSMDAESSFSSSVYFQNLNSAFDDVSSEPSSISPLGPNSIYELTIASDLARARRRASKTQVTLNGGVTTVYNLKVPTTKDIPPIQLEKLKKITNDEIASKLLKDIDAEYKMFDDSYKSLTTDTLQKFTEAAAKDVSVDVSSTIDGDKFSTDSNYNGINEQLNDKIPTVFSDPKFRLDDPRVFKKVIGEYNILPDIDDLESGGSSKQNIASNNQLQDKLSHYLDSVEISLIDEISKSSNSFFSTIEDIKTVQNKSEECVDQFKKIKKHLEELESEENTAGLRILSLIMERKKIEMLESSIIQIKYVTSLCELAQSSFSKGNNAKCLNEILLAEGLIYGKDICDIPPESSVTLPKLRYPLLDISGLPALFNLQNDLQNLKNQCSRGYIIDFNDLLIEDLKSHYSQVPLSDTLNRMYYGVDKSKTFNPKDLNNSYQLMSDTTKASLKDYVENLVKSGHLSQSFQSYQDRIIVEVKDIIKMHIPKGLASADNSNAPSRSASAAPEPQGPPESNQGSGSLSSILKSLSSKEFELMLVKIFCGLSECFRRLTLQQKILLDLALSSIPPSEEVNVMVFDLTLAINKAIELTQLRLSKIINVRSEQLADSPVTVYTRFYSLCSTYLQECELINPGYVASGAGSSLNDWVKNHVSYFVHRFHSNCLKSIAHEADKEVWREVTDDMALTVTQNQLNEIILYSKSFEGRNLSPVIDEWRKLLVLFNYGSVEELKVQPKEDITKLTIEKESFMVPKLALTSIRHVRDYLIVSRIFQIRNSPIENNVLNFFKLLNAKTAHAILNAGATRTAGLKHITTKHLALSIQEAEFNIALLAHVSTIFKSISKSISPQPPNINQAQGGSEELTFSKIINTFKDHESELCSKLVSIMYDRTVTHCNGIVKIDWTEPLMHPKQCHTYMEVLVKETLTVAKVLQKYLPEVKYSLILSQIFNNYKKLLVECFCTQLPQFKDFNEKHSLLKDIDYFRVKLCELPGYATSGQVIWENVNALPTIEDMTMDEVMRHNIEGRT
ncbi:Vps54-domain-containing protein [Yamadazyma tenuis ATCC 10573]|uniref:Vps54-domain-containing protein n=1 Tax=Candida tenuis (strain ATCC 10573 / BCRC 21748 / CBS 615 / JCM 9827 / NBRC 10315 / NRRL Y-1498 / VKM Y-70) TaxID=590646 RepID=G3AYD8_CANTC|nr:Vps54-domain-containing protein [Yamadazyma tenuis ATCC 10573]EGV65828.1 Vps54-domain-containing protein [Yamadazyma tenuis ATCC 10573]